MDTEKQWLIVRMTAAYQCQNGGTSVEPDCKYCPHIDGNPLEEAVLGVIRTHVLTEGHLQWCQAMHCGFLGGKSIRKTDRLAEGLQEKNKIEQASQGLALAADPSGFWTILKQLWQWRKELKKK